jgi:hypothetical protein
MPINPTFASVLTSDNATLQGLFAETAQRLGTSERNVEKDFWVCLTLDILFNGLPKGRPRLLFKGGTSLSKAFELIQRFSEDIDVTVFRQDVGQEASAAALEKLSGNKRKAKLDDIRDACAAFIQGPLLADLTAAFAAIPQADIEVVVDPDETSGQTLLVRYRSVTAEAEGYVPPVVRIESGGKSALDPHAVQVLRPYVAEDLKVGDLHVANVVTVDPARTFWDKVVIVHGLRRWFDIRGALRQEGQRVSRHYYDLYRLAASPVGAAADDVSLGADCVRHARLFFDRADYDLASAKPGSFALVPHGDMVERLRTDYAAMSAMLFGAAPPFDDVLAAIAALETRVNAPVA